MGIFIKQKSYIAAAVLVLSVCILMIVFADIAVLSAKKGISLWLSSILPAMLPFFICVSFLTGIGIIELLPVNLFPFAMSILSGYPMGAKVVGDMCRSQMISRTETRRLMSFCSTSGPVFMVGAVGVGMLGSQDAGFVIAIAHYAGAVVNGVLYSAASHGTQIRKLPERKRKECDMMEVLTSSIFAGFRSMAVILAYIIFFMFIMDIIATTGVFDMIHSDLFRCLSQGFVEMTVGCSSVSAAGMTLQEGAVWAAVIISWGGLSILGQSMSMLSGCRISFAYLMMTKFTHSIFAGIIALFLGKLML